ncbi:hypothetical protein EDF46_0035 [Frondihabitans sp. PhB188]|uniref:tetratricopeptide repeat protein n=1 Tax=Frondihabitans sp. PhB188 TaxID=2485200 RepID=UPI000FB6ED53|nr:hypothetical protein EDF46_0035 [Frondihabitans sp. PhB188]
MATDPEAVLHQALTFEGLGQTQRAFELVGAAVVEHPGHPRLLTELASLQADLGDLPRAEVRAREAVAAAPNAPGPRIMLANIILRGGRKEAARKHLDVVLQLAPDHPAAHINYALTYLGARSARERAIGRQAYERALELSRGSSSMVDLAAMIEHDYGNDPEAIRLLDQALELEPQNRALLKSRVEYSAVGEQTDALTTLLQADPGDSESRELLDAVVTWRRRAAGSAPLIAAFLPALLFVSTRAWPMTVAGVVIGLIGCALAGAWYRGYLQRLPEAYRRVRRSEFRGFGVARALAAAGLAALAAAGVAAPVSVWASSCALGVSALLEVAALSIAAQDDRRVLRTARARTGYAWYGTANRFGTLRQELALWTALATAVVGLSAYLTGWSVVSGGASVAPLVAIGVVTAAIAIFALCEAIMTTASVPHRFGGRLAFRYRLGIAALATLALVGSLAAGALTGFAPTSSSNPSPGGDPSVVDPDFDFATDPVTVPHITFSVPPVPTFAPTP